MGKFADLDFVTAPHLIPSENPDEQVATITWILLFMQFYDYYSFRSSTDGGSARQINHLTLMKKQSVTLDLMKVSSSLRIH